VHRKERERAAPRGIAGSEPAVDRALLAGEARDQGIAVRVFGVLDAELASGQAHDVVRIDAGRKPKSITAQPLEQAAELPFRPRLGPTPPM
jgi:hypothetical protein